MRIIFLTVFFTFAAIAAAQGQAEVYKENFFSFDEDNLHVTPELEKHTPREFQSHPEYGRLPSNVECTACVELVHKRTINSRYFIKEGTDGDVMYIQQSNGALHYQDRSGFFRSIDQRLTRNERNPLLFEAPHQPVPTAINLEKDYAELKFNEHIRFQFNQHATFGFASGSKIENQEKIDCSNFTAGKDGVLTFEAWENIDREQIVGEGQIKTNYRINKPLTFDGDLDWVVFSEKITVPIGFSLKKDPHEQHITKHGHYMGDYVLFGPDGKEYARINSPIIYDQNPHASGSEMSPVGYNLQKNSDGNYILALYVLIDWLEHEDRKYPVVVDPLVTSSATYSSGVMGFAYDGGACFVDTAYCSYNLQVMVPAAAQITNVLFSAQYFSYNFGCSGVACNLNEAAFRIYGPCGVSPGSSNYWSCFASTSPGTCSTNGISMFNTAYCVTPQCVSFPINFEMRTYQCSCNLSGCSTSCHSMPNNKWTVTIEARTVELFFSVTHNGTATQTICEGDTADITATGFYGVPPYTYSWAHNGSTNPTIHVSPSDTTTYTCTITDSCGVTYTDSVVLNILPKPNLTMSAKGISCFGNMDGEALVQAVGTGPFTYSWSTSPPNTNDTIDSLSPGIYYVTVTGGNGCAAIDSVTINGPSAALTTNLTVQNVGCNGTSSGSVTANPSGGTAPYTYLWSTSPAQTTATASGLPPGTYTVTVTDNNGCEDTASATVNSSAPITYTLSSEDVECYGGSSGWAAISLSGGAPPFNMQWGTTPVQNTDTATNLSAGTYVVQVADSTGCTITDSVVINEPPAINISITAFNPTCHGGNDGAAVATANGGTGGFSYAWNTTPVQVTDSAFGLAAGTYTVVAFDSLNCADTASVTLHDPPVLNLSIVKSDVKCFGEKNGSAKVIANGGVKPYSYVWSTSPAQYSDSVTNLGVGTYSVSVTDNVGCMDTISVTIVQPKALSVSLNKSNISCTGLNDGKAWVANISGGTTPYNYLWSNSTQTDSISNLSAGSYALTITDSNGCSVNTSVTVTNPPALQVSLSKSDPSCGNIKDGTATATPAGGTPSYSFQWNTSPVQNLAQASGLGAGSYSVTVTDANGCTADGNISLVVPPDINLQITTTNETCDGDKDGSATVTASGGQGGFTYAWSTVPVKNGTSVSGLSPGIYYVTATDQVGCQGVDTFSILAGSKIDVQLVTTDASCHGLEDGTITANVSGSSGPYTYSWSNGKQQKDINNLAAGNYLLTVTGQDGCISTASAVVNDPDPILVNAPDVEIVSKSIPVQLDVTVVPNGNYIYSWNPPVLLDDPSAKNPITIPTQTTKFTVEVTDVNSGCTGTDSLTLFLNEVLRVVLPTAFTPNDDGKNDLFFDVAGVELIHLTVANRWGQIVHDSDKPWDGTDKTGAKAPMGVYIYLLEINYKDAPLTKKGNVTLIR